MLGSALSTAQCAVQLEDATGLTADFVVDKFQLTQATTLRILQCGAVRHSTVLGEGTDRTGLFVWSGSKAFCACIAALHAHKMECSGPFDLSRECSGLLELGGGVGLGALSVATLWRNLECWTTDAWGPTLDMAVKQAHLNAELLESTMSKFRAAFLDWHWLKNVDVSQCGWDSNADSSAMSSMDSPANWSASEFLRVVSSGERARPMWLVGLDIVYPDHLDANLMALFFCVRSALLARRYCSGDAALHEASLFAQFTMSFVDRDVGMTLRRMLLAATISGLMVLPLSSPFHPVATRYADAASVLIDSTIAGHVGVHSPAYATRVWSTVEEHVLQAIEMKSLGLKVCGSGEWLLSFSLAPADDLALQSPLLNHNEALSQLSHVVEFGMEGRKLMQDFWWSAPWVSHVLWLWPPGDTSQWNGAMFTANHVVAACPAPGTLQKSLTTVSYFVEQSSAGIPEETVEDATVSIMMMTLGDSM